MGNICSIFSKNDDNIRKQHIQIATPLYECPIDFSNQVPIGIPITSSTRNDNQNYYNNEQYLYPINHNRPIIINNTQPYYNNGLSSMDGFLTGMLIGELLDNDCTFIE